MSATYIVTAGVREAVLPRALRTVMAKLALAGPCLLAIAGVAGCTWISFRFEQNLGSVGFLYLIFVVLAAVYGGFWQASIVSLLAVGCLDYFFNEPVLSLTVVRFSDFVELGAFELTALIISQLSNRARARELEAAAERRDTSRLYQIARRILLLNRPEIPGAELAELIREIFELRGVILFDAIQERIWRSGELPPACAERARDAHARGSDEFDAKAKSWYLALRLGAGPTGALALCGTAMSRLNAAALASLTAIALERARALEQHCRAEAARQAEQLRTAVLDALAHKIKTPLTIIRTAGSGLRIAGELSELQRELASLIDQEARKLTDLASRLVGAPGLDFEDFKPQPEPLLFSRLIKAAIQELELEEDRGRFRVVTPLSEPPVFADRALILTALAQLVDNALTYSSAGTTIDIGIVVCEATVALKVRSQGLVVSPEDRDRIFERFYRARDARDRPGTGLGLSIVKTIAADQHGSVWAEGEPDYGTVFSFSLPIVPSGVFHEQ